MTGRRVKRLRVARTFKTARSHFRGFRGATGLAPWSETVGSLDASVAAVSAWNHASVIQKSVSHSLHGHGRNLQNSQKLLLEESGCDDHIASERCKITFEGFEGAQTCENTNATAGCPTVDDAEAQGEPYASTSGNPSDWPSSRPRMQQERLGTASHQPIDATSRGPVTLPPLHIQFPMQEVGVAL